LFLTALATDPLNNTSEFSQCVVEVTCVPPISGAWVVAVSCTFQGSATAPANVVVEAGIALTIDTGASLDIDFSNFHLLIKNGAKVVVKSGAKIF